MMEKVFDSLVSLWQPKFFMSIIVALLSCLVGDLHNPILHALLILIICDWTTGIYLAILRCAVSSKIMVSGAIKLLIYFILIIVAHQLPHVTSSSNYIADMIYTYLALSEAISILENLFNISRVKSIEIPILGHLVGYLILARVGKIRELQKKRRKRAVKK